jgi:F-type H+-transporting ATPase subunit delta
LSEAIARRYAAAMADVAVEQKNAARVRRDFGAFVETFYANADLRNFLESPAIGTEMKHKVVGEVSAKMGLGGGVRNFAYLIVSHGRTELLREIEKVLREELNTRMGIADAEVVSARRLTDAERQELMATLERRVGKKIEASFREDQELLGGAVVRVGSTIYDGSVREKLNRMREQLSGE